MTTGISTDACSSGKFRNKYTSVAGFPDELTNQTYAIRVSHHIWHHVNMDNFLTQINVVRKYNYPNNCTSAQKSFDKVILKQYTIRKDIHD